MRRKVIQIADSTQLISLPRKWALKHGIKKGDELDIEEKGAQLRIGCDLTPKVQRASIALKDYGLLAKRAIHAFYKQGADEIRIELTRPDELKMLQTVISNETVGFEIIEHSSKHCTVKNISGHMEGFDGVLRRTWLLLSNMADDAIKALETKNMDMFDNLILLEESNNRFTSVCRRYLNKYGSNETKPGPLYYIVEDLENLADEYKYLFIRLRQKKKLIVPDSYISIYKDIAKMILLFRESYYKYDVNKLVEISNLRKSLVERSYKELEASKNESEFVLGHHALVMIQKIFNFVGPLLIIVADRSTDQSQE